MILLKASKKSRSKAQDYHYKTLQRESLNKPLKIKMDSAFENKRNSNASPLTIKPFG